MTARRFNEARAQDLGAELKARRKRAGLTQAEVAARLGRSDSHVSRWEQGRLLPSEADTASMLALYDVTGEDRATLLMMAREAADPNWIIPGIGAGLTALVAAEKAARRIVNVEPQVIPGLCQTGPYARAVIMIDPDLTRDQVEHRVRVRVDDRQATLDKADAPHLLAIIGEAALRYHPCDSVVMAEQLRKLLALCERPNVTIVVVPFAQAKTPAQFGSFSLVYPRKPSNAEPIVRREGWCATTTITSRRDVRKYQAAVEIILRDAMSAEESKAFIARLLREKES